MKMYSILLHCIHILSDMRLLDVLRCGFGSVSVGFSIQKRHFPTRTSQFPVVITWSRALSCVVLSPVFEGYMLTTFKFHLDWHGGGPVWYVVVSFACVDLVILTNNFWSSKATAIGMYVIFGYVIFNLTRFASSLHN